jgi:hypothetical protein
MQKITTPPCSIQGNADFFQNLRQLDLDLFTAAKAKRCTWCGGRLDTSHFPRKLRDAGWQEEELRFSLCCRNEGCRKRVTPPSLRFFGRKVYSAWAVILVLDFCEALGLDRMISRQTIARYRQFWQERLAESHPFMRWARGQLPPGTPTAQRPGPLLHHFGFPSSPGRIAVLRFFTHVV